MNTINELKEAIETAIKSWSGLNWETKATGAELLALTLDAERDAAECREVGLAILDMLDQDPVNWGDVMDRIAECWMLEREWRLESPCWTPAWDLANTIDKA